MKFYTVKQIFNLIILLCSRAAATAAASGRCVGVYARTSTRPEPLGSRPLPRPVSLPIPARLQPAGIIKHARVLRGSRKNISPFVSCRAASRFPGSAACPANCQKSFFKRAARLGFFFMRFQLLLRLFLPSSRFSRNVFQPHCTCCAGSFVAGFSFRRKFA